MKNLIVYAEKVKLNSLEKKTIGKIAVKKKGSDIVAFTYKKTDLWDKDKKANRLFNCGKTVVYAKNPTGENPIPVAAMRCGIRLCPSCSWIRAHKIFQNVYDIISASEFAGKKIIFLTLTVKNCKGKNLDSEINRLMSAWQKLTANARQPFRKSFLGTFRALEVTYNPLAKTYHPHLHAMAVVEPDYFRKSNKNYISQPRLRELWRTACGLDYLPQCRIEKVRDTSKKQVAEVAKYTVKSADYLNRPQVIEVLDPALRGKRLVAYGGLFKSVKARLSLPDEDDLDELPRLTVEEILRNPYVEKIVLEWQMGRYHVSIMQPPADPAEWLDPGRLAAEVVRRQGEAARG